MPAKYIIRLDDASEYMDYKKWNPYFDIFDEYDIKPIVAVIPCNKDPKMVNKNPDQQFWGKVRNWQKKGYHIALHGYEHLYSTNKSGIIGMNRRSEFAGVPFEKQKVMIEQGIKKFKEEGVETKIFVAPAHSFDKNTVRALKEINEIEYISDGYFLNPVYKDGIKWIPQQLGQSKIKNSGVWTMCYHPETLDKKHFNSLKSFIHKNHEQFISLNELNYKNWLSLIDFVFQYYYMLKMKTGKMYFSVAAKRDSL